MKIGNAAFELADQLAERERLAGIQRAQAALRGLGEIRCIDCEEPIDPQRRAAMPSARRCLDCQLLHDRARRKVA